MMIECAIYKGIKKPDAYLFVTDDEALADVPQALLDMLGKLEFVMTLSLDKNRKLVQADVEQVMQLLKEQGYFLQIPPKVPGVIDALT